MNAKYINSTQLITKYTKKLLLTLLAVPLFAISNVYADNQIPPPGTVNQLCFDNVTNLSVDNVVSKVTDNTGLFVSSDSTTNCLTVETTEARDASANVVKWVQSNLVGGSNWRYYDMATGRGTDSTPNALSFAIKGDLNFIYNKTNYTCSGVIFGQGKSGAYNNWWGFANVDWTSSDGNYDFVDNMQLYPKRNEFMINCNGTDLYLDAEGSDTFEVNQKANFSHGGISA